MIDLKTDIERYHRGIEIAQIADIEQTDVNVYKVESLEAPGKVYFVRLNPHRCTCEDWIYRGEKNGVDCKHIVGVLLAVPTRPIDHTYEVSMRVSAPTVQEARKRAAFTLSTSPTGYTLRKV